MSSTLPSSASPTVARSQSTSSRSHQHRPTSSELPHRTRSVAHRPSTASQPSQPPQLQSQHLHASQFRTQAYDRPPPPASNQAAFDNIARRDLGPAKPARRSSSRNRSQERPATAHHNSEYNTPKKHQRNLSVQGHQRDSIDMAAAGPITAEVSSAGAPQTTNTTTSTATATAGSGSQSHPAASTQPKRRTTITTPSGQWALGKTIGAGSMGKVKLAKNMETGEQVSRFLLFAVALPL